MKRPTGLHRSVWDPLRRCVVGQPLADSLGWCGGGLRPPAIADPGPIGWDAADRTGLGLFGRARRADGRWHTVSSSPRSMTISCGATDCLRRSLSGREWSQDRVYLGMPWVVEVSVGGLAEIEGGAALLVAKVGVRSVFE